MSWKQLQDKLQSMKATGENGFEGLCAKLLSTLLETPFVVARALDFHIIYLTC